MNRLLLPFLLLAFATQAQNILRVNNIPGVNAPFSTIADAVAAASAGDIILVEGSPFAYAAGFSITKKVILQGPGYFLNENSSVQASKHPAVTSTITLAAGSEGSVVSGFTFSNILEVRTSNIIISNNRFSGSTGILVSNTTVCSNLLVHGNYFEQGVNAALYNNPTSLVFTNVVVTNNYISGKIMWQAPTFGTIKNNIISHQSTVSNYDIANNIFVTVSSAFSSTTNATIRNNLFVATSVPEADGTNLLGVTLSSLFLGLAGNTPDTQWKLKVGSPAIGAGEGGIDCGIYSGVTPYKISGVGAGKPAITAISLPPNVPQNGTLNIKVSAKVN